MSDDTRTGSDAAPGVGADRTRPADWPARVWPADLDEQIDALRRTGSEVLALAFPWAASVSDLLFRFEAVLAPLHLDDDLHRRVGESAGIADLYDLLDAVSLATSDFGSR